MFAKVEGNDRAFIGIIQYQIENLKLGVGMRSSGNIVLIITTRFTWSGSKTRHKLCNTKIICPEHRRLR